MARLLRVDTSVTVSCEKALELGAIPGEDTDMLVGLDKFEWRVWSLNGKRRRSLSCPYFVQASTVRIQLVDDQGDPIPLPADTSAKDQVAHALKFSKCVLCVGCKIKTPAGVGYDAVVTRLVPDQPFCTTGPTSHVSFQATGSAIPTVKPDDERGKGHELTNPSPPYGKSAGRGASFDKLRELVLWPTMHFDLFQDFRGLGCPRGILLHGEPGTGKTTAARMVAQELALMTSCGFLSLSASALSSNAADAIEQDLHDVFQSALDFVERKGPRSRCIIFLDELEGLFPKRAQIAGSPGQNRAVAQLLTLMDGAGPARQFDERVTVIGATNLPDHLDPALRRPGRFETEILFAPPVAEEREQLFVACLSKACGIAPQEVRQKAQDYMEDFCRSLVGFVGADIELLAGLCAASARGEVPGLEVLVRERDAFGAASLLRKRGFRPQAVGGTRSRVGGYQDVKFELERALEWPIRHKDAMDRMGLTQPRGILMYGPPGCSKTTLARSVALSNGYSFFALSSADVYSPYVGDAEKTLREVFANARLALPAVVFLDEIDAMVGKRGLSGEDGDAATGVQSRVLSTLLNEMDGVIACNGLLVLAATNRMDMIDEALLRPGRFDRLVPVPLPGLSDRKEIIEVHTDAMPLDLSSCENMIDAIARRTDGLSGAELEGVCQEAGMRAIRAQEPRVAFKHFFPVIQD